jgi:hypothetical protein
MLFITIAFLLFLRQPHISCAHFLNSFLVTFLGQSFSSSEPDDYDEAILLALNEQPFVSLRQLTGLTHLPRATVHRRLTR